MIARRIADLYRLEPRLDMSIAQRQPFRRRMKQPVPAPLGFEHQGKRRIAGDLDASDMVHLDGDGEIHGGSASGQGGMYGGADACKGGSGHDPEKWRPVSDQIMLHQRDGAGWRSI